MRYVVSALEVDGAIVGTAPGRQGNSSRDVNKTEMPPKLCTGHVYSTLGRLTMQLTLLLSARN
jgi:hypothetical protein